MRAAIDACFRAGLRLAWLGLRAYFAIFRPKIRASVVLVHWEGQLLLVTNSYRKGQGFPGGMLKWREDPRQGACRELEEEVGLAIRPDGLHFLGVFVRKEWGAEIELHAFGLEFDQEPTPEIDQREVVEAVFFSVEEAARRLPESRDLIERFAEAGSMLVRSPAEGT
ncbi:MAG: NUDIX hydrolase [Deltaproteobacteria bacterium]|nr:NUDIX hydrolase [Deltaproteobacteria bacterium]MBW2393225.1 NUDIX hydrolase [Deltaproteobacteria bacterium]